MKKYRYSKKTNAFYPLSIDYIDLPNDCVLITEEDYHLAKTAREEGKPFEFGEEGLVVYDAAPASFYKFNWVKKIWILDKLLKQDFIMDQNIDQKAMLKVDAEECITLLERKVKLKRATEQDSALLNLLYGFTIDLDELDLADEKLVFPEMPV